MIAVTFMCFLLLGSIVVNLNVKKATPRPLIRVFGVVVVVVLSFCYIFYNDRQVIVSLNPFRYVLCNKSKFQTFHLANTTVNVYDDSKNQPSVVEITHNTESKTLENISRLFQVKEVNCTAVIHGNKKETKKAIEIAKKLEKRGSSLTDEFYLEETIDCQHFQKTRGYVMSSLTKEEQNFPIAFSMLTFKNSEHVERLLRAIYRPQNLYCIHVDRKSPESFYLAVKAVANCFTNVFLTSRRIDVQWGRFSILEPEFVCMKELWRYKEWKYFINLTGQEFPLKTNWELVKILTAYNKSNDVEGTIKRANTERWKGTKPPLAIRATKGSVHITVNRDFVDYILHNKTAETLLNWTMTTDVPDETFFSTLNHNPQLGIRGSYNGTPETDDVIKPFLTRSKNWGGLPCAWKRFRGICILTTGDLSRLAKERHLFANKFYLEHDRVVIGCLEEKLSTDTLNEYMGVTTFNTSYYAHLGFVKNQVF